MQVSTDSIKKGHLGLKTHGALREALSDALARRTELDPQIRSAGLECVSF